MSPATSFRSAALYSTDVTGTSVTLSGLTCNTTYTLRVSAYDAAGNSSSASTTSGTTDVCAPSSPPPPNPPPPGDTSPPSQPANLGVTSATQVSVSLMWTASEDNTGVTGYQVYVDGVPTKTTAQPGATVAGLACGRGYTFEVDAYDSAHNHSLRASVDRDDVGLRRYAGADATRKRDRVLANGRQHHALVVSVHRFGQRRHRLRPLSRG